MEYNSKILENKTLNLRLNYYILTNQYRLFQYFFKVLFSKAKGITMLIKERLVFRVF